MTIISFVALSKENTAKPHLSTPDEFNYLHWHAEHILCFHVLQMKLRDLLRQVVW